MLTIQFLTRSVSDPEHWKEVAGEAGLSQRRGEAHQQTAQYLLCMVSLVRATPLTSPHSPGSLAALADEITVKACKAPGWEISWEVGRRVASSKPAKATYGDYVSRLKGKKAAGDVAQQQGAGLARVRP